MSEYGQFILGGIIIVVVMLAAGMYMKNEIHHGRAPSQTWNSTQTQLSTTCEGVIVNNECYVKDLLKKR